MNKAPFAIYDECQIISDEVPLLMADELGEGMTEDEAWDYLSRDAELFERSWEYFLETLEENMTGVYFKVIGRDMGWQSFSGHKYIEAQNAKDLLGEILPSTDTTLRVFKNGKGFCIRCSHHDAPMGEWYDVRPISEATYQKNYN